MKPSEWEKCPDLTTRDFVRWSGPLQVHPDRTVQQPPDSAQTLPPTSWPTHDAKFGDTQAILQSYRQN